MMMMLLQSICTNDLVGIYDDTEEPDKFFVGYILHADNDGILIAAISSRGEDDGFVAIKSEEVFRIEKNSKYINCIKAITEVQAPVCKWMTGNIFGDLLQYAKQNHFVVSIQLLSRTSSTIDGFVKEIEDGVVTIEILDEYGNSDGETSIFLEDCLQLSCNGLDNRKLQRLANKAID